LSELCQNSYFGAVNFLLQNTPDAVVNWVKIWRIRRQQCRRYEIKFPPILMIFDREMARRLKLWEVHSFWSGTLATTVSEVWSQISTNFGDFWQRDGKEAKIMRGALIFHPALFVSQQYHVKRRYFKCHTTLKVVSCKNFLTTKLAQNTPKCA